MKNFWSRGILCNKIAPIIQLGQNHLDFYPSGTSPENSCNVIIPTMQQSSGKAILYFTLNHMLCTIQNESPLPPLRETGGELALQCEQNQTSTPLCGEEFCREKLKMPVPCGHFDPKLSVQEADLHCLSSWIQNYESLHKALHCSADMCQSPT